MGIVISGLPLEEYLFFILIPYSCLFIHYVYLHYSAGYSLPDRFVRWITAVLIFFMVLISLLFRDKIYTVFYSLFTAGILLVLLFDKTRILNKYYITYLIMLVPFIIVNALLTGTFLSEPVVWYNGDEIIGERLLTIPVEDFLYLFSLIAIILLSEGKLRTSVSMKPTLK
jgi:lycopene cyclase domain-containing protein